MTAIIDLDVIHKAPLAIEPYPYFLGAQFLREDKIGAAIADFPAIGKPGYLTVDEIALKGSFKTLIEELEGGELTDTLSEKFGRDLHHFPRLTTIMKRSHFKHGAIHTDGDSKVMTMLVYMNDAWAGDGAGRLRVLYNGKQFEPYAVEVPPVMGTVFGFLRSDNSWHGHRPFSGARKVVQVAWIKDAVELARKKKRNSVAQFFKGFAGKVLLAIEPSRHSGTRPEPEH